MSGFDGNGGASGGGATVTTRTIGGLLLDRVETQIDRVSSTTFVDALSIDLSVGVYEFYAIVAMASGDGGIKLRSIGTAVTDSMLGTFAVYSSGLLVNGGIMNAYGVFVMAAEPFADVYFQLNGLLNVTTAGNFRLQFGQATSNATESSVLPCSFLRMIESY